MATKQIGEFYRDTKGQEYYRSYNGTVFSIYETITDICRIGEQIDSLPADAELLFMTNGGIYPILANRLERKIK